MLVAYVASQAESLAKFYTTNSSSSMATKIRVAPYFEKGVPFKTVYSKKVA